VPDSLQDESSKPPDDSFDQTVPVLYYNQKDSVYGQHTENTTALV